MRVCLGVRVLMHASVYANSDGERERMGGIMLVLKRPLLDIMASGHLDRKLLFLFLWHAGLISMDCAVTETKLLCLDKAMAQLLQSVMLPTVRIFDNDKGASLGCKHFS